MKDKRFEIRIDEETQKILKALAYEQKTSCAEQIRRAIRQRYNFMEKKKAAEKAAKIQKQYDENWEKDLEETIKILKTPWVPMDDGSLG